MPKFDLAEVPRSRREVLKAMYEAEDQMNPALLLAKQRIEKLMEDNVTGGLHKVWRIGKIVANVNNDVKTYGANGYSLLRKSLSHTYTQGYLAQAANFYRMYDEEQLSVLLATRTRFFGHPINWMHIQKLITVDDASVRQKLLDKIASNELSPDELQEEIEKHFGRDRSGRHPGGRPIAIPATTNGKRARLSKTMGHFIRDNKAFGNNPEIGLVASVRNMPIDRVDAALVANLDRDIETFAEGEAACSALKKETQEARQLAAERLANKAQEEAKGQANVIDAEFEKKGETLQLEHKPNGRGKPARKRGAQEPVEA